MAVSCHAPDELVKGPGDETPDYSLAFAWDPELHAAIRREIAEGLPPGSVRTLIVDARRKAASDAIQAAREALSTPSGSHTISDNSPLSAAEGTPPRAVGRRQASPSKPHSAPQGRTRGRASVAVGAAPTEKTIRSVTPASFEAILPARPYCADDVAHGLMIRRRSTAIGFKSIQINHLSSRIVALVLDVDRADAATSWLDAGLPQPNVITISPESGRAHLVYVLRAPVLAFHASSSRPQAFFEAVQRGYIRRLRADPGYSGMMTKNPLHPHWRTLWGPSAPYSLEELDRPLDFEDKAPVARISLEMGFGRNSTTFETVRKLAYRECIRFKVNGGTLDGWQSRLATACAEVNGKFASALSPAEIGHIAKSIAKWTWKRFNVAEHCARQRQRVQKRWEGHEKAEPWKAYGMSERTYYRRKKAGTLPAPADQPVVAPRVRLAA